jgi:hypothetical protein
MSRRVASASRARSRGRSRAREVSPKRKSFEELFSDQARVVKLRKGVQKHYPKKKVEELVSWLPAAQVIVDARKTVQELRTWDPATKDPDDYSLKRRQLFASREDILQSVPPDYVKKNAIILDEFLGQGSVLVVDEVDCDCVAVQKQHGEWFARLQQATRNSTSNVVALQTQLAEGGKSLLGSDGSTASSLSLQWRSTDEALQNEERLLGDMTCLQVVRECVRAVLEAAEDVCAYLARSKDDWSQMHSFQQLSEHLNIPRSGAQRFVLSTSPGLS